MKPLYLPQVAAGDAAVEPAVAAADPLLGAASAAEQDSAARDAKPSKLDQGADWYDRGTATISRGLERCTGKDMRAINISFILVTSFVKLILITSQLVAETNRLASEGIGTNNPNLVRFFAHFKSADTALWLVLLASLCRHMMGRR